MPIISVSDRDFYFIIIIIIITIIIIGHGGALRLRLRPRLVERGTRGLGARPRRPRGGARGQAPRGSSRCAVYAHDRDAPCTRIDRDAPCTRILWLLDGSSGCLSCSSRVDGCCAVRLLAAGRLPRPSLRCSRVCAAAELALATWPLRFVEESACCPRRPSTLSTRPSTLVR